jgi:hypothetical protein
MAPTVAQAAKITVGFVVWMGAWMGAWMWLDHRYRMWRLRKRLERRILSK